MRSGRKIQRPGVLIWSDNKALLAPIQGLLQQVLFVPPPPPAPPLFPCGKAADSSGQQQTTAGGKQLQYSAAPCICGRNCCASANRKSLPDRISTRPAQASERVTYRQTGRELPPPIPLPRSLYMETALQGGLDPGESLANQ